MTKTDLINAVAASVEGNTKKNVAAVVDAVFGSISASLKKGEKVQLIGFGTFETRKRAAREGRNPQNPKKTIKIPAKTVPAFRPGKALKDLVK
ncbi:MAG: HU family DNA-binding protein [Synergistaceae bacterium]|nr:HU family DNA-binding protein [Synergistaceae bacterium]